MPNQEDLNKQMQRILAILAKAESTEFHGEADALTRRAEKMMAKYGIEAAQLAAAKPGADNFGNTEIWCQAPWPREKGLLLAWLANAMRCRTVRRTFKGTRNVKITLYGFDSDRLRVEVMFTSLVLQMLTGARRADPGGASSRRFHRSWIIGFIFNVTDRIEAIEGQASEEAGADAATGAGTALVLVERSALVNQRFEAIYPDLKVSKSSMKVDAAGYEAGVAAGERADIGGMRVQKGDQHSLK